MEFQEHKRLIELLPDFLQRYREYQVIMDAEQEELDCIHQRISDLLSDAFTDTATEEGIAHRERMYHMTPAEGASLKERRLAVKIKESSSLPYTIRRYRQMLDALCGDVPHTVQVNPGEYQLKVSLEIDGVGRKEQALQRAIRDMSRQIIPANLVYTSAFAIPVSGKAYTGAAVSRKRIYHLETEPVQKEYQAECCSFSGAALCQRKQETIREA